MLNTQHICTSEVNYTMPLLTGPISVNRNVDLSTLVHFVAHCLVLSIAVIKTMTVFVYLQEEYAQMDKTMYWGRGGELLLTS